MVREFRSLDFWKWLEMMDGTPIYKNAVFVGTSVNSVTNSKHASINPVHIF